MKIMLAAGMCLMLGLWISQSAAEEIQWRRATPLPADGTRPGDGTFISPTPASPAANSSAGSPFPFRAARAKNDDDAKPLPQGMEIQLTPMPGTSRVVVVQPETAQPPQSKQSIKLLPMPSQMPSTAPMQIIEEDGMMPFVEGGMIGGMVYGASPDSCGCGTGIGMGSMGGMISDGGSCGMSCGNCCGAPMAGPCGANLASPCCVPECGGCCYDSNRKRAWVSAEFLMWGFSRPNTPPLLTGGPNAGNLIPGGNGLTTGPALGLNGTNVLYGGDTFNNPYHLGGRLTAGFWFPHCDDWGLEFSGFYLGQGTSSFTGGGSGFVGRPFFDVVNGIQSTEPVNGFNGVTGTATVDYTSQLYGAEADLRHKLCCGPQWRMDLLLGYRFLQFNEAINITENLKSDGIPVTVNDRFSTRNQFNGAQIGLDGEVRFCQRWFFGTQVKVAFGDIRQTLIINGATNFGGTFVPSGVFANASTNQGTFVQNHFCVVPEVTLKLGVDVTERLRLFVGYNFLYISSVVRPGDNIDTTINTNFLTGGAQTGGPARPAVPFATTSFWAQGLTAGLEYHY